MSPRRLACGVGAVAITLACVTGEAHAAYSQATNWWCGQMSPNVCQKYSSPDQGTGTYRHNCLLNEGWHSQEDVDIFCLD